ncbi:hypothetical protein [Ichthyenterobacterium magnum]|uniref:Uncharacterized protein n=1 Tax=Ichthyenterobacterium magnum TaxID=1230530 RepID=A0A420DKX5_9FLAO|nr:hypothetical protein [Ichthyenterobacterium magnum]RKE94916.1 hypothetical protein BXY80_1931 [Ichthyenterobacterium magnum]
MSLYKNCLQDFKERYIIYIPLTIILQSCIGSIAAMYILMNSTLDSFPFFELSLCVILSMLYNASVLAQLNYKFVFNLLIMSTVINTLLIIINLISLS